METNTNEAPVIKARAEKQDNETKPKPKSNKWLTIGLCASVVALLGSGTFAYLNWTKQPEKITVPVRKHVSAKSVLKQKIVNLGVHIDKNHIKAVNLKNDELTIIVNNDKIVLKNKQFVDYKIKDNEGQIYIQTKDQKLAFNYDVEDKNEVFALTQIDFAPATKGLKNVAVTQIKKDAKIAPQGPSAKTSSSGASGEFCDKVDISDNTAQMRDTFKSIAHNLNLGPLEMLLGPAVPRIIQNSQKIALDGKYINYVTTEDGKGTLGEYLPDILQKDSMTLGTLNLNMSKAMSDSNLNKIIINKNTTALYPSSVDEQTANKLAGCF